MNHPSTVGPSISMGQFAVARHTGVLRTLLGSCVGLALYDRRRRIAGLAHVVLPQSNGRTTLPGKFVDTAIPALLQEMHALAKGDLDPTARLAGGANMFATTSEKTIGALNIAACEQALQNMNIPIVGRHCGGEQGRRMTLDAASGIATIQIVGQDTLEI